MKIEEFMHRWMMHYIRPEYFYLPYKKDEKGQYDYYRVTIHYKTKQKQKVFTKAELHSKKDRIAYYYENEHNNFGACSYQIVNYDSNISYGSKTDVNWNLTKREYRKSTTGSGLTQSYDVVFENGVSTEKNIRSFYLPNGKYKLHTYQVGLGHKIPNDKVFEVNNSDIDYYVLLDPYYIEIEQKIEHKELDKYEKSGIERTDTIQYIHENDSFIIKSNVQEFDIDYIFPETQSIFYPELKKYTLFNGTEILSKDISEKLIYEIEELDSDLESKIYGKATITSFGFEIYIDRETYKQKYKYKNFKYLNNNAAVFINDDIPTAPCNYIVITCSGTKKTKLIENHEEDKYLYQVWEAYTDYIDSNSKDTISYTNSYNASFEQLTDYFTNAIFAEQEKHLKLETFSNSGTRYGDKWQNVWEYYSVGTGRWVLISSTKPDIVNYGGIPLPTTITVKGEELVQNNKQLILYDKDRNEYDISNKYFTSFDINNDYFKQVFQNNKIEYKKLNCDLYFYKNGVPIKINQYDTNGFSPSDRSFSKDLFEQIDDMKYICLITPKDTEIIKE